jgi:hypothetical protein
MKDSQRSICLGAGRFAGSGAVWLVSSFDGGRGGVGGVTRAFYPPSEDRIAAATDAPSVGEASATVSS